MPFKKGRARTGGRKAGVKYRSIREELTKQLDEMECNPFVGMARIALDDQAPIQARAFCNAQLAKYLKPQLKAVEVSGPGGTPIDVNVGDSARQRLLDRINAVAARLGKS